MKYIVQCWVTPRSGFDVARKSRIIGLFRKFLLGTFPDSNKLNKAINNFEKKHEGHILEPFIIESDIRIKNPEKQLMPEIRKTYPEAQFISCNELPDHVKSLI